jgi:cholinesterase
MRNIDTILNILFLFIIVEINGALTAPIEYVTVQTTFGPVKGIRELNTGYEYWKGIPYAAPPVGSLRWKPPMEPTPWSEVKDTVEFGAQCPQDCNMPEGLCGKVTSEDCLFLNVYRPGNISLSTKLPVMIFIPGGHFDMGTAGCQLYEGRYFAQKGKVVLVTINYRLGALGFMVDTRRGIRGNYGFQDQRLALQWVQKNIANFGGDPNQVTLFGESAGASSVNAHMISPLSKGLFHRAILQSNPFALPLLTVTVADRVGQYFAKVSNCSSDNTDKCYMDLHWQDILKYQQMAESHLDILYPLAIMMPYTPVIDGKELSMQELDSFSSGNFFKTDIMMGTCSEEARMFIYLALHSPLNYLEYEAILAVMFLRHYLTVERAYPALHRDKREDLCILGTDYMFGAPTRYALTAAYNHTRDIGANMYLYEFDHAMSFDGWGPLFANCNNHTCHGADMPFTFHSFAPFQPTPDESILSDTLIVYWTNFAYSGSPNKGPNKVDVEWEAFSPSNLYYMKLQTPKVSLRSGLLKDKYDMWDRLGYKFHSWSSIKTLKNH